MSELSPSLKRLEFARSQLVREMEAIKNKIAGVEAAIEILEQDETRAARAAKAEAKA